MSSFELARKSGVAGDGSPSYGPIQSISQRPGDTEEVVCEVVQQHVIHRCDYFEDFLGDVLPDQINLYDQSPSGSPTLGLVSGGVNGQLAMTLASTNEFEIIGFDWGNQRPILATKRPYVQFRFNVAVLPSTNERIVFGLGDILPAGNHPTLDNFVTNIWGRLEASGVLQFESDDGTTDAALASSGVTLVAGTWYIFTIDAREIGRISYQLANGDGTNWREIGHTAAPALTTTPTLQPVVYVQKDSGAGVPSLLLDFLRCSWDR
jgi:hypothetical protein